MKFELNTRNIILIATLLSLILIAILIYNSRYGEQAEDGESSRALVNNYSRFFTVQNAANTYFNFLARGDVESLLILLSDDYIDRNNLNRNNVLLRLDSLDGERYDFTARRMYQTNLSANMIKYYIYGHLSEARLDEFTPPIPYYLILIFDTRNWTFSITPYDGASFRED